MSGMRWWHLAGAAGRWPHPLSIGSGVLAAVGFVAAAAFRSMLAWPARRDRQTAPLAAR